LKTHDTSIQLESSTAQGALMTNALLPLENAILGMKQYQPMKNSKLIAKQLF